MPKNTNLLMIRHAEKPSSGETLSVLGQARAQAYAIYFQHHNLDNKIVKPNILIAAADTTDSHRSRLTLTPLSQSLNLKIDCEHRNHKELLQDVLQNEYNNSNILICWHHGDILALAEALGVKAKDLPTTSDWPAVWPDDVFGWLLQICFDQHGRVIGNKTLCMNQKLMHGDYGQQPPTASR